METTLTGVSLVRTLQCSCCRKKYSPFEVNTYATCCNVPLVAEYAYEDAPSRDILRTREKSMWRYAELLPVLYRSNIVSLGEGMTPVLSMNNLLSRSGMQQLLLKDESLNPTGSFKARGISMAVSKAKEFGITNCIIPTAGNAGGALAAYCAKAGIQCTVVMPRHTPKVFRQECELFGARLILVDGLISDCAKKVEELKQTQDYFDISTLKEPYRLEGKKTMGYEIAEQLNWELPEYIFYPAGGGTGLIGIWKAFREMQQMRWIRGRLPKMVAVQALNCNPLMRSCQDPDNWKQHFIPAPTIANGLAVPYPFGLSMMKTVLRESSGTVVSVSDRDILDGVCEMAREEGLLVAPEGAALWKALLQLRDEKIVPEGSSVLLLNTGSGYKYLENLQCIPAP